MKQRPGASHAEYDLSAWYFEFPGRKKSVASSVSKKYLLVCSDFAEKLLEAAANNQIIHRNLDLASHLSAFWNDLLLFFIGIFQ